MSHSAERRLGELLDKQLQIEKEVTHIYIDIIIMYLMRMHKIIRVECTLEISVPLMSPTTIVMQLRTWLT